jgi:two-component system invasion response regulator UvrY
MRILIADDHAVVRRGLRQILAEAFKRAVFGEAANSQEALDRVWKEPWDIVILDLTMPGRSGLDVLKEIKRARPKLPVLMLSMHPEDQFAVRLLKAGASGYMTKESAPEELVGAVNKAVAGGRYVSPQLAEKLASFIVHDALAPPHENLSDREFLILRLIASGKPVSAIARDLSLSVKTVSTYRARLLEKMSMKNNSELVHYAFQYELVDRRPRDMGSDRGQKQASTPTLPKEPRGHNGVKGAVQASALPSKP